MSNHNFKKLIIGQKAMNLSGRVFEYYGSLPSNERHNLTDQLNRCSVSKYSVIANGFGKRIKNHFAEFYSTTVTSGYEMETQLLFFQRRKYGNKKELESMPESVTELQKKDLQF